MKLTLQAILVIGLLSSPTVDGVAAAVRADRPIDIKLDRFGTLSGEIYSVDHLPRGVERVLVYSGRRLVADVPVTAAGEFRIEGLDDGLYWVTAPVAGQAVRIWALSSAPPQSQRRLVLVPTQGPLHPASTGNIVRGQSPVVGGSPTANVAPPMPAYPFQPYQVPGGGVMWPGTYTSPGSVFLHPLVTAAVVTGVATVIVVVVDDDDESSTGDSSVVFDFGPGSP